ncbi:MAG: hypothetical protein P8Z36_06110 [Gemmatimonadota bacterium]|jgi:flagellar basal body L-ring protein FlgH
MIRIRSIIAACTLALLAGCNVVKTPQKDATTQTDTATQTAKPAQSASQAPHRPLIFQPVDRAKAASDSMASRAARMNAAADTIMH